MSHVHVSFETPEYTGNVDALGTLRVLEAVRILDMVESVKIYHASSSELFGKVQETPQSEDTPFYPRSPYGVAKIYAFWITRNYREAYGMFAANGILFNHESPRRGETFVTRKITRAVAEIALGRSKAVYLGNLDAERDWGHAKDYVRGMWMILQSDIATDYVMATGEKRSIREFAMAAFDRIGICVEFKGSRNSECGIISSIDSAKYESMVGDTAYVKEKPAVGQSVIKIDPYYFRPTEVDKLLGDSSKIRKELGWQPEISFDELVSEMVTEDLDYFRRINMAEISQ
jgi:GDPmannose 4,6-dehydratase